MSDPSPDTNSETEDRLLGGRVRLLQPRSGFRAAIDPVFLQAAVPAAGGERVLDLGAGSGAAALALAARVAGVRVVGLEKQADLVALARRSAALNAMGDRVEFAVGDVLSPPFRRESFDHVMANPPYLPAGRGNVSPDPARRAAAVEDAATLADWCRAAVDLARPGASITFVHRFDRAEETARGLVRAGAGNVAVLPLWPRRQGEGAKRALIQGRKEAAGKEEIRRLDGIVLHDPDGGFSDAAEAVLRRGEALCI